MKEEVSQKVQNDLYMISEQPFNVPVPLTNEQPIIKKPTLPEKKKVVMPVEAVFQTKIVDHDREPMKNPDMKLSDAQKSGGVVVAQSALSYKNANQSPKQASEVPILKFEIKNIGAPTIVEKPQPMMNYQF